MLLRWHWFKNGIHSTRSKWWRVSMKWWRKHSWQMATNKPWNSTKTTESWEKMSIIYIIFFLFPRPTLITIYIDLRLAWHWFSSEDSKKNSGNLRRRDFLQFCSFFLTLASSSNINFHQEIFSVRMLFIFLTVTLLCFDIILMFFFSLFLLLWGTGVDTFIFLKFQQLTLFPYPCIEIKLNLKTQKWRRSNRMTRRKNRQRILFVFNYSV